MLSIATPSSGAAMKLTQINVKYDEPKIRDIDRVAAAKGMSRPELVKAAVDEAIEAYDGGRLSFQTDDAPRIEGSVNSLTIQVREAILELDRSQRANQRHEKKLLDAFVGSEEAVRQAQENLMARINDINRKSYEPFLMKLAEVQAAIAGMQGRLNDAQGEKLSAIQDRLDAVHAAAKVPRTQHNLVLGDDTVLAFRFLLGCGFLTAFCAILLFLITAGLVPWLGKYVASRTLTDTRQICGVINDRYGVTDCSIPDEYRRPSVRSARASR
ncbi:hypothetical protein LWE61_16335 [Sphingobium sufflavum]|nr:hypothetical protein [Sphingobium sufflavum]